MKVLIISHLPMATQNNMGKTFLSLLSEFSREELCQLYIYPAVPNVDCCASFYRITDKDVMASFLGTRNLGGEIDRTLITKDQGLYENPEDESFYRNRKNKSAMRRLLRDAMWSVSGWYNANLKAWLDREKPDCIFVAPGVAKFLYNIALRISEERKIPVVTYICDEYYFVKQPEQWLDRLRLKLLQKKIEKLLDRSAHLVVISRELEEEYTKAFSVPASVVMTGTSYSVAETVQNVLQPQEICYFGNIRCNRYVGLAEIGRELDIINCEFGTNYKLNIYSSEKDPQILSIFDDIDAVKLCGFLSGAEFDRAFHEAQLLLHVEAFDEKSVDFTKHSISTKIADSLASGIPLVAYGPREISSMGHLLRNDCAIAATSREKLRQILLTAFTEPQARDNAARNGLQTAKQYHESGAASRVLRRILTDVLQK